MTGLLVALAGGLGAATRFWVDGTITQRNPTRFPLGTLLINVSGSLLLGLLVGWASGHAAGDLVAIAGTGFLGGYTTFSTASVEAFRLVRTERDSRRALSYTTSTLIVSLFAAGLGLWVTGK